MFLFFILFFHDLTILGESRGRLISHDEQLVKTVKHQQEFDGEIIDTFVDIEGHSFMDTCADQQNNLVYVFTHQSLSVKSDHLIFYLIELETNNIYQYKYEIENAGVLEYLTCTSEILLITLEDQPGIWVLSHRNNMTFHDGVGIITDIFTSKYNPTHIAIVTDYHKANRLNKLKFFGDEHYREATFKDIQVRGSQHQIEDIINVVSDNKIIYVVVKDVTNTVSREKALLVYISIITEYHIQLIQNLPGIVFLSQSIDLDGKTEKFSAMSLNHANSFIPLHYKANDHDYEWYNIGDLIINEVEETSGIMISRDGGHSWAEVKSFVHSDII
ncbi:hypothetical protein RF11_06986 [Thelohanellus kitauei]|uniref:Sortilin N-terminal domain-containing protein n=1 Tax=Thelohanellus kitauei TaxID=669202 RepID=A0A0C2N2S0_THEKT|nr:hypothetical protein RF11_06986 [Thelohanellus kitauei]